MATRVPYQSGSIFTNKAGTGAMPAPAAAQPSSYQASTVFDDGSQAFDPTQASASSPLPGGTPTVPATAAPVSPAAITQSSTAQRDREINDAYNKYLGRGAGETDLQAWRGNDSYDAGIAGSQEAKNYAQKAAGQPVTPDRRATTVTSAAPPGFDQQKWNDPAHLTDKYLAGRMLVQGAGIPEIIAQLNSMGQYRYQQIDTDKIQDNEGRIIDLRFDQEGANTPQWTEVAGPGGVAHGSAPGGGGPAGGGAIGGAGGNGGIPPWLQSLFGGGGPGASLPGGFGDNNADPMSNLIDSGTAGLILNGGATPQSNDVMSRLMQVINNGGVSPDIATKMIGAREDAALAQRAMLGDARAALAGQGTLSVPGVDQGATNSAIERTSEAIAPQFAGALRDIYGQALDESNQSFMTALQAATGMSDSESKNLLAALGQGTSRQQAMAGIALDSLQQNMDWNKFLAQHGLDTAKVEADIENGRMSNVIQLLQLFLGGANSANGGYA